MSRRCYTVWVGLRQRLVEKNSHFFYKIVNKIAHIQAGSILAHADSQTRANHRLEFVHVRTNCESFRHSIFDWNGPPYGIMEAETTVIFKLKYHSDLTTGGFSVMLNLWVLLKNYQNLNINRSKCLYKNDDQLKLTWPLSWNCS